MWRKSRKKQPKTNPDPNAKITGVLKLSTPGAVSFRQGTTICFPSRRGRRLSREDRFQRLAQIMGLRGESFFPFGSPKVVDPSTPKDFPGRVQNRGFGRDADLGLAGQALFGVEDPGKAELVILFVFPGLCRINIGIGINSGENHAPATKVLHNPDNFRTHRVADGTIHPQKHQTDRFMVFYGGADYWPVFQIQQQFPWRNPVRRPGGGRSLSCCGQDTQEKDVREH